MEYSSYHFEVIIIGAGVMGSSTAYQLAKRGHRTLLLEQFDFLHNRGSSHGESRTIRATYPEDYYYPMVVESARLWEAAQSEIGYNVYFKTKHFDLGPADRKSLLAVISSCQQNGMPHCVLDHRGVAEQFSSRLSIPADWIGVMTKLGGVIEPTKAVSMFQTLAVKNGAVLRDNTEALTILKDEKGLVVLCWERGEKYSCKKCIVTAGAWIPKLVKTVSGKELPIQPVETAVCYWRIREGHEDGFIIAGGFPTFASYGNPYLYGTPSLEFPGLIKISVHGGYPCDPDKRPWGPGVKLDDLKEWIKRRFNGLVDANGPVATQLCMYSMTPDEDFLIDFLGGEFGKDVVVAGGFSRHGFKMAPAVGRILADLATDGQAQGVDLKYFRIGRFENRPKGNVKEFEERVSLG